MKIRNLKRNPFEDEIIGDKLNVLFVNRDEELNKIVNLVHMRKRGIICITGNRGEGKTTLLLKTIKITGGIYIQLDRKADTKEILEDILYKICETQKSNEKIMKKIEEEWQTKITKEISASIEIIKGKKEKEITKKYTIKGIIKDLRNILSSINVVFVDELDKEEYNDILKLLDNFVKYIKQTYTLFVFTLPSEFARDYKKALLFQTGKESIASYIANQIVSLEKLNPEQMKKIINKRLNYFKCREIISDEALDYIANISNSNPRFMLRICETAFNNCLSAKKNIIDISDIKREIKEIAKILFDNLNLEEKKIVEILINEDKSIMKSELFAMSKLPRTTFYDILYPSLVNKNIIKEKVITERKVYCELKYPYSLLKS